jgi:hypothetical protein
MTDPALQALLDKQQIAELLTRYLRSVDRGDVATFARIKADGQYYHSFTGARMIDRLERRDGDPGTWGIAHRQLLWDWNHDAPEEEHWMRGLLAPDPSVLRLSAKFPADPVYAPR